MSLSSIAGPRGPRDTALALLAALLLPAAAGASQGPPPEPPPPLPPVHAVRLREPVTMDGALEEAVWREAPPVTRFVQSEPVEGGAPFESTEVRVAFDDQAVYIGARCWDSHPDSIVARLVRRDTASPSDRLMVYLDPFHDRRSGYYFGVNAAGVLYDGTLFNDDWDSDSWDGVWEARARVDDRGWTCEMRIPFSQLRFDAKPEYVWGINFSRRIERRTERDYVAIRRRKEGGFVSRFPELLGIGDVHRSASVEVLPYVTSKAEYLAPDPGDPFNDGSSYLGDMGGDLRMGVGSNLTLNATVNPDFGQVEVDPAVVNLSDVETFYPEKRPFFTENSRIFNFGNEGANDYWNINWPEPMFFYSRRIGRSPQGDVSGADYSDVPPGTRILGAGKLTGKLAPGWNFGALAALTDREQADLMTSGVQTTVDVEPLTFYGNLRGQREFRGGHNGLGAMASIVRRDFQDPTLESQLNRQSLVGGLDGWHFLDGNKTWVLSGWAVMSNATGTPERMVGLQESSRHYLQRPDAGHVSVDSSATSLTGFGSRVWLNKQKGAVLFNAAAGFMDPKFDVNDLGFMSYGDVANFHVGSGYQWTQANSWRKYANLLVAPYGTMDLGGVWTSGGVLSAGQVSFLRGRSINGNLGWTAPAYSDRRTRGGPRMYNAGGAMAELHFENEGDATLFLELHGSAEVQPATGSQNFWVGPYLTWKPASNVALSFGPDYIRNIDDAQYVTQMDAAGYVPPDFGDRRYVFAHLDQTTVGGGFRINWSFTPNLSLQTYLQPLISAGHYTGLKELARSRSYEFITYGQDNGSTISRADGTITVDPDGPGPAPPYQLDDPDFNFRSLRGNAVLRWEYRPGSTLFFVWTQERSEEVADGSLDFGQSVQGMVSADANNIFMLKLTYYLDF